MKRPAAAPRWMESLEPRRLFVAVAWDGASDGDGDGVNWQDRFNWSNDTLPTVSDDVTIDIAGSPSISLATGTGLANTLVCNETFSLSTTLAVATSATFNAALNWTAGSVSGPITIGGSATANFTGASIKRVIDTMTNDGTVNYTGTNFQLSSSTFNNNGTFNATDSGNIATSGSSPNFFNNSGTFNKTGASTVSFGGVSLVNTGSFNTSAGTINLAGGSTTTPIDVPSGATLQFQSGTFTLNGTGNILGGAGTINVSDTNNSTQLVLGAATATVTNLTLTAGTVSAGANTLTLAGVFNWTGGSTFGSIVIDAGATANLTGTGIKRNHDTMTNNGAVNYTGTNVQLSSATFNNAGAFNATDSGSIATSGSSPNFFNNSGTFNKTGASTVSFNGVFVANTGSFNTTAGTINFGGGGSTTMPIDVPSPATLQFTAFTFTLNGTGNILGGTGTINLSDTNNSTQLVLGAATATVSNLNAIAGTLSAGVNALTLAGTFDWIAGAIAGVVTIAPGAVANFSGASTKAIFDTMTNNGVVNYDGTNFQLGSATFNNAGTFNITGGGGIVTNGSSPNFFNNTGTLAVSGTSASAVSGVTLTDNGNINVTDTAVLTSVANVSGSGNLTVGAAATVNAPAIDLNNVSIAGLVNLTSTAGNGARSTVKSIAFSGDGTIDLRRSALAIDYTGASPLADVRAALFSGRNGGTWDGSGIISTVVATSPGAAIGYGESSEILGASGGMFAGLSVDGTAILLRTTRYGDSDLDLDVDLSDLGNLATHYGSTSDSSWGDGDFDYDDDVDLSDLGTLATYYGTSGIPPQALLTVSRSTADRPRSHRR